MKEKQNKKRIVTIWVLITLFVILAVSIYTGISDIIDEKVASFAISIRNDHLTNVMKTMTNLGGGYALIALCILLLIIKRNKKFSVLILGNLILVFLESQILKFIFRRPRPTEIFLAIAKGYSFPSGHTMVGSAFYIYLNYLICKNIKNKLIKTLSCIITIILILMIGFSRIYLGVHHTTDVIGGYILAIAHVLLIITITKNKGIDK